VTVRQIYFSAGDNSGILTQRGTVWANVRGASSAYVKDNISAPLNGTTTYSRGTGWTGTQWYMARTFLEFDITAIPTDISNLELVKLRVFMKHNGDPIFDFYTFGSDHSSPLALDDFDMFGATQFASDFNATAPLAIDLNAAGLAYVNSKLGSSAKFAFRQEYDYIDDAIDHSANHWVVCGRWTPSGRATISLATDVTVTSAVLNGVANFSARYPLLIVKYAGGTESKTIYPRFRFKWWKVVDGEGSAQYSPWQTDILPDEALTPYNLTGLIPNTEYRFGIETEEDNGVTLTSANSFTTLNHIIYPTSSIVRVSSIVHRYNRAAGQYQLEVALGEVDVNVAIPYAEVGARSSSIKKEEEVKRDAEKALEERINRQIEEEWRLKALEAEAYRRKYPGAQWYGPQGPRFVETVSHPLGFEAQRDVIEKAKAREEARWAKHEARLRELGITPRIGPPTPAPPTPAPKPSEPSLWQKITPWKEEAGETLVSEAKERVEELRKRWLEFWK